MMKRILPLLSFSYKLLCLHSGIVIKFARIPVCFREEKRKRKATRRSHAGILTPEQNCDSIFITQFI